MLGTGNALVTRCYNTCFALEENGECFLVDGGGGNTILTRLEEAGIEPKQIRNIFVTHKHIDHLMGIIWVIRVIGTGMADGKIDGDVNLYAHADLTDLIEKMARTLLNKRETDCFGKTFHIISLESGDQYDILGHKVTFFDIHSTKAKQFGFTMDLSEDRKLTCCGDEPYVLEEESYVRNSTWLLHEAFCLCSQADLFDPYEKHHSTVKEACQTAEDLKVENLILYHTEDKNLENRKTLYGSEGRQYYHGNLFIPDDMESFEL